MVAVTENSTYLAQVGKTLLDRGVDKIELLVSWFGPECPAHSQVTLIMTDGSRDTDKEIVRQKVDGQSVLTNGDILEMFIGSNCRTSGKHIRAGKWEIDPRTWQVTRVEAMGKEIAK